MVEFSTKEDFDAKEGDFSFSHRLFDTEVEFFITKNRENIKSIHFSTSDSSPLRAIFYGMCLILKNSTIQRVKEFSERELDSFLRDENHIPCMEGGVPSDFISVFYSKLVAAQLNSDLKDEVDDWKAPEGANYVEKIGAISDFFAIKLNPSDQLANANLEMQLVHLTDDEVICEFRSSINRVKQQPNSLDLESRKVIEELVRRIIGTEKIKLVVE